MINHSFRTTEKRLDNRIEKRWREQESHRNSRREGKSRLYETYDYSEGGDDRSEGTEEGSEEGERGEERSNQ